MNVDLAEPGKEMTVIVLGDPSQDEFIIRSARAFSPGGPRVNMCIELGADDAKQMKEFVDSIIIQKSIEPIEDPADNRAKYYAKKLRKAGRPKWRQ